MASPEESVEINAAIKTVSSEIHRITTHRINKTTLFHIQRNFQMLKLAEVLYSECLYQEQDDHRGIMDSLGWSQSLKSLYLNPNISVGISEQET